MAKLNKSKKDKDLYWYTNKKGEKLWMYRHKYKDIFGNRKEKKKSSFESEDAALKALLKVKADLLDRNMKQVEKDQITISQWFDIWYETNKKDWKEPTRKQRERILRMHIKPLLGNYKLSTLDKSTYKREFINELIEGYSFGSVHLYHTIFKSGINAAVDDEILLRNRFKKVSVPEKDHQGIKDNYLDENELNKLLSFSKEHSTETNYSLVLTLAYTGLRKGEALGLQWNDIDFDSKSITVERTRDHIGIRSPKSKNSYRTIPVDDLVLSHLKNYKKWCKEIKFQYGKHLKDDDLVFTSRLGNPITCHSPNATFNRLIEKGNLKQITLHGLRHTHATVLLNLGLPPKAIADRLGNSTKMINEVYGHTLKETENKAVQLFSASLGAASGAN
ncbi:tyrosine-type recombinase/integrase [Oceanobacillus jeddahense]|uniref:tyrosine-type recombinase/integrase n=1 Tax=Oceanobacillus jeddahense TaxID=1462527 RepID=UPI000595AAA3|nr:tyrosine-type recombinase/integrase [Oceanobacillus jeddahense]